MVLETRVNSGLEGFHPFFHVTLFHSDAVNSNTHSQFWINFVLSYSRVPCYFISIIFKDMPYGAYMKSLIEAQYVFERI